MTTLPKSKNITGATTDFLAKPRTEQIAQTSRGIDELAKNFADFSKSSVDRTPAVGLLQKAEKNALVTADSQKKIQRQADSYAAQMRQARIDAINQAFAPRIKREQEEGQGRLARVDAMNFARGIIGSGADTTKVGEQRGLNEKALRAIEDEKAILINEAFGYADALGKERAEQLTKEAQGIATSSVDFYKSQAEKANQAIQMFGKQGVKLDELKKADINTYNTLREISGMSDFEIENMLRSNNPSAKVLKTELVGNKVLTVTQNADGTIDTKTYATDIGGDEELKEVDGVAYGMKLDANGNLVLRKLTQKNYAPRSGGSDPYSSSGVLSPYANDLEAIIGATISTIPTKFGQATFASEIKRARDDGDKISLVASQVLKGQPAEFKNDFRNQAVGIKEIDKAINELKKGVETGFINNAGQYVFNVFGKDFDPKLAKIQGYITSAIQPYRNSVTGAAWGDQEDAEYASLFGSTKYSPPELLQRLEQTKELLKTKSAEGLNAYVNPLGEYDNVFNRSGLGGKTINDYRAEFPQASDEELQALMAEEQGL